MPKKSGTPERMISWELCFDKGTNSFYLPGIIECFGGHFYRVSSAHDE